MVLLLLWLLLNIAPAHTLQTARPQQPHTQRETARRRETERDRQGEGISPRTATAYTRLLLDPAVVNTTATSAILRPGRPRKHPRNPLLSVSTQSDSVCFETTGSAR